MQYYIEFYYRVIIAVHVDYIWCWRSQLKKDNCDNNYINFDDVIMLCVDRLQVVSCMPPPVSSAVILTKSVGGNEVIISSVYSTCSNLFFFLTFSFFVCLFRQRPFSILRWVVFWGLL